MVTMTYVQLTELMHCSDVYKKKLYYYWIIILRTSQLTYQNQVVFFLS